MLKLYQNGLVNSIPCLDTSETPKKYLNVIAINNKTLNILHYIMNTIQTKSAILNQIFKERFKRKDYMYTNVLRSVSTYTNNQPTL